MSAKETKNNMTKEEVLRLGALARIDIPESQVEKLRGDIGTILSYVENINEAGGKKEIHPSEKDIHIVKNILREDVSPHESGIHTEAMLSSAPARQGNFLKVKKIL